ncbi:MAG: hypothetical protein ACK5WZ_08395, partial [Pseudobdellovibrionaceae bacterium]
MKILILLPLFFFYSMSVSAQRAVKIQLVKSFGPQHFENAAKQKISLNRKLIIQDDLQFDLGENAQAQFEDSKGNQIYLFSRSKGVLQFFSEKQTILLDLHEGSLRLVSAGKEQWITLRTEISSTPVTDQDIGFRYQAEEARVELVNFRGSIDFRATFIEMNRIVSVNQKAFFQGLREDGELAFDLLLHGKKIPKGILSETLALVETDRQDFKIVSPEKERLARELQAKIDAAKAKGVCKDPVGDFDQCAWKCVGFKKGMKGCPADKPNVSCVRVRCNANGVWSDSLVLNAEAGKQKCQ